MNITSAVRRRNLVLLALAALAVLVAAIVWFLSASPSTRAQSDPKPKANLNEPSIPEPAVKSPDQVKTGGAKPGKAKIRHEDQFAYAEIQKDPQVRKALATFEGSLKNLESARAKTLPTEVKDDGFTLKRYITAPDDAEIRLISENMQKALDAFPPDRRRQVQPLFQKLYDDYASFKLPYRSVMATKARNWDEFAVVVANTRQLNSTLTEGSSGFFFNPKDPKANRRYDHLFELEEPPPDAPR